MKGKLSNLSDHLFAQLERLNNTSLSAEEVAREVERTEAMVELSDQILKVSNVRLSAAKLYAEHGDKVLGYLPQIGPDTPDEKS